MADNNQTISIITLNANGLNTPIKRDISVLKKTQRPNYV